MEMGGAKISRASAKPTILSRKTGAASQLIANVITVKSPLPPGLANDRQQSATRHRHGMHGHRPRVWRSGETLMSRSGKAAITLAGATEGAHVRRVSVLAQSTPAVECVATCEAAQ